MLPMHLIAAIVGSPNSVITLSGEIISAADGSSPYNTTSALRINTDGTIDKGEAIDTDVITWTQIDAATDWIIPNGKASPIYEIRVTGVTGTFTTEAAAVNVWVDLSSSRQWTVDRNGVGTSTVTFTLEIRFASGATLDTGAYSIEADNS